MMGGLIIIHCMALHSQFFAQTDFFSEIALASLNFSVLHDPSLVRVKPDRDVLKQSSMLYI